MNKEKREFFRLNFKAPVTFKSYSGAQNRLTAGSTEATSKNISQSGLLFRTENNPPQLSSILWMNLDIRTLKICQEIENRALVCNDGVLGKVVRVEEDPENNNIYDVGICFLTREQKDSKEVQDVLAQISQNN